MSRKLRLCLVGNSHLACIKLGWDRVAAQYPGIECSFLGATQQAIRTVHISDGCIVLPPQSERGDARIFPPASRLEIAGYDAICLVGLRLGFYHCVKHLSPETPHSDSLLHELFRARLAKTAAIRLARSIRGYSQSIPLLLVATPLPSEELLKQGHDPDALRASFASYWPIFVSEAETLAQSLRAHLICQPAHTIAAPGFTCAEYSHGSIGRTGSEHAEQDFAHMNARYGADLFKIIVETADRTTSDKVSAA